MRERPSSSPFNPDDLRRSFRRRKSQFVSFLFFFSLNHLVSQSGGIVTLWELDEGAVSAACAVAVRLLLSQLNAVILDAALPQARGLQDLLHQLLEGTLDTVPGLSARL